MAINTEYSRILFKRSTVAGVVPTIPTGTTIDNTWLTTDIMVGEGFLNTVDDRLWFRTDNGLYEIANSGGTDTNYYTTGATLVGNTIYFDRNDMLSAYSIDLSSIVSSGGTSGGWAESSGYTGSVYQDNGTGNINLNDFSLATNRETTAQGKSSASFGYQTAAKGEGSVAMGSGSTASSMYSFVQGQSNSINSTAYFGAILGGQLNALNATAESSAIIGGTGNTINAGVERTVILGGHDIVADRDDTTHVYGLNIKSFMPGAYSTLLTTDASGNVSTASTASIGVGTFLPLSGGSMTGDITTAFNKGIKYDATRNIKFEGFFGYTGTTINGGSNASILVGNRYDGGIEIASWEPNAVLGLYANTGSFEIYDASGIVINDNNKVEIGVDSKEEITLADNTAAATTSTNVDKKAVTIGSRNSKFNAGVVNSVILGGSVITASTSNTVYVPSLNVKTVGAGTPIINLGLDSSGNVVTGTTGSSGSFLPLSGGTLTGALTATTLAITSIGGGTPTINLGLDASGNVVTGTTGGGSPAEQYWTSGSTATSVMPTNPGSAFATITNAGATSFLFGWNSRILGGSDNYNLGFNSDIKGGQANWNIGGNNQVSDAGGDIYAMAIGQNNNVRGWSIAIGNAHTTTNGSNALGNVAIGYNNYHNSATGTLSLGSYCYVNAQHSIATGYNTRTNASYSWAGGYSPSSTYRVIANAEGSFVWMNSSGAQELGTYATQSTILGGLDHNIATGATGSTIVGGRNNRVSASIKNSIVLGGYDIVADRDNTAFAKNLNVIDDSVLRYASATTMTIVSTGASTVQMVDNSGNIVKTGVTNSTIIAGSGNTINSGLSNVLIAGIGITATTSDISYFSNVAIKTSYTPSSSGDTAGVAGQVTWDNTYAYIKTNTGWGRVALDYGF